MADLLSSTAVDGIRQIMDETTSDANKIPGCVAVVVDKSGKTIFSHASGKRGADTNDPMTLDTVFWIASCTKMIAGIAAMQLVEQDKLALDDADQVEHYCPELKTVRIVKSIENGKVETVPKKNRITLRMLLNHTGMNPWAWIAFMFFSLTCNQPDLGMWYLLATRGKVRLVSSPVGRYTFFYDILRRYSQPAGIDELDAHASGIHGQPILFEPGT